MNLYPDTLAPFVSTPPDVVDRMLVLGEVGRNDIVYDLGCGDGRILVAAAKKYGARGVGVDIQTGLMEMTLANIAKAGVERLVEFRLQDAQTVDLRPATVIMLYLMDWSNARFQSIIQNTCRPGTRVVSHTFGMPNWEPAKTEKLIDAEGHSRMLFLWRVGSSLPMPSSIVG